MYYAGKIVEKVKELARKYPNAEYTPNSGRCSNVSGVVEKGPETHGCIVGQAIRLAYPELYMKIGCPEFRFAGAAKLLKELNIKHTCHQAAWLSEVQYRQDKGFTWGRSIETAQKVIKRY